MMYCLPQFETEPRCRRVHQVHGGSGDPSPFTAYGTIQGIKAALQWKFGDQEGGNYSFAVQGAGHVGIHLVRLLREEGAKVFVTDINQDAVAEAVEPDPERQQPRRG